MFRRNKGDIRTIIKDGRQLIMSSDTYDYITKLERERDDLKDDNRALRVELETIKPDLAVEGVKPAVHIYCCYCKYSMKSRYNGDIIGCNRECVCREFSPKEE